MRKAERLDLSTVPTEESCFAICLAYNPRIFREPGALMPHNDDEALTGGTTNWSRDQNRKCPGYGGGGGGREHDSNETAEQAVEREILKEMGLAIRPPVRELDRFRKIILEPKYMEPGNSRVINMKWDDIPMVNANLNKVNATNNPFRYFAADVIFNGSLLERKFIELKNKLMERSTPSQIDEQIQKSGLVLHFTAEEGKALGIEEVNEINGIGFFPYSYLNYLFNVLGKDGYQDAMPERGKPGYFYYNHLHAHAKFMPELLREFHANLALRGAAPTLACQESEEDEDNYPDFEEQHS